MLTIQILYKLKPFENWYYKGPYKRGQDLLWQMDHGVSDSHII